MTTDLTNWQGCSEPDLPPTDGRLIRVEAASFPGDAAALFAAVGGAANDDLWRYLPFGPFDCAGSFGAAMNFLVATQNWKTHLFRDPRTDKVLGMSSYMRVRPEAGSAEIGCIKSAS